MSEAMAASGSILSHITIRLGRWGAIVRDRSRTRSETHGKSSGCMEMNGSLND
jgi:hypothetical protein